MDKDQVRKQERRLIAAMFFERRKQLGGSALDLAPANDRGQDGRAALKLAMRVYFDAGIKTLYPRGAPGDNFLLNVGILMANIGRPGNIFKGDARRAAIATVRRLLDSEGWRLRAGQGSEWSKCENIDPGRAGAGQEYLELLTKCWEYTGNPLNSAFDDVRRWWSELTHHDLD